MRPVSTSSAIARASFFLFHGGGGPLTGEVRRVFVRYAGTGPGVRNEMAFRPLFSESVSPCVGVTREIRVLRVIDARVVLLGIHTGGLVAVFTHHIHHPNGVFL